MGKLRDAPRSGGTAADGTSCAYVADSPLMATVGIISTNSFEHRQSEPESTPVHSRGGEMFLAKDNAFRDARLYARQGGIALMITVAASDRNEAEKTAIAQRLATAAFEHLVKANLQGY